MLVAVLCTIIVIAFFWAAFRKPKLVPRGMQNLGELGILAVRDQILRPALGRRGDVLPAVPRVAVLLHLPDEPDGADPGLRVPGDVEDRVRGTAGAHGVRALPVPGLQEPGCLGLCVEHVAARRALAGVHHPHPGRVAPVLHHPAVHARHPAVREHVRRAPAAAIFIAATWYLASFTIGLLFAAGSAVMVLFVFLLELLVDLLQAFIFTTLTATYIASSLEAQH
jgi:F-type H+-transporting ATPase subunit a